MNRSLTRALQLLNLSRYADAERLLRESLLAEPHDGGAHALLARALLEQDKLAEGTQEAETAVGLAPDAPFAHFVVAQAWQRRNYRDKAEAAIDEAIRLDPHDADYHAFRSALKFEASRWEDALKSAEQALAIDPEHIAANNFRAMALVKLGRRGEAGLTIDAALARDPDDAFSHANKGWALLEGREPKKALDHFREALRLDPTMEYARVGIIEALKARNPIYGLFLRYMLAMAKLPPKWQVGVIIGLWFVNRLLRGMAKANPALAPFVTPILIVYLLFALLTWLAQPLFNLLLRLHPLGKHALSPEEKLETNLIGGCIGAALLLGGLSFIDDWTGLMAPALAIFALAMPLHLVFTAAPGWPRMTLIGVTLTMISAVFGAALLTFLGDEDSAAAMATAYIYMWLAAIWGGQLIAGAKPRK